MHWIPKLSKWHWTTSFKKDFFTFRMKNSYYHLQLQKWGNLQLKRVLGARLLAARDLIFGARLLGARHQSLKSPRRSTPKNSRKRQRRAVDRDDIADLMICEDCNDEHICIEKSRPSTSAKSKVDSRVIVCPFCEDSHICMPPKRAKRPQSPKKKKKKPIFIPYV